MTSRFNALLFGSAVALVGTAHLTAASAADKLTVPLATWGSPTHVGAVNFVEPLRDALYRLSGDRISLRYYPSGQIGEDVDMPVSIPTGKVKFGWTTIAGWSGIIPDTVIGDAPTGLTMLQMARATDAPGGIKETLDEKFRSKGATLLAVTDLGPIAFVSNKKIVAPQDLKGLKVRVYSEASMQTMLALGAAPVKLPFADVYTAMQRGTIEAALIGFSGIASQRMYEVSDYVLVPASFFGTSLMGWAANLKWWEGLNKEDREIVSDAVREAELICRYELIKSRSVQAEEYREKGMEVTILDSSSPHYDDWVKAMNPLLEKAKQKISSETFAPIQNVKAEISQSN